FPASRGARTATTSPWASSWKAPTICPTRMPSTLRWRAWSGCCVAPGRRSRRIASAGIATSHRVARPIPVLRSTGRACTKVCQQRESIHEVHRSAAGALGREIFRLAPPRAAGWPLAAPAGLGGGRAGWQPWLVLLAVLLPPLVLLGALLWLLQPLAYGWLLLPVHLLVLLYSLGRGDVKVALGAFRDAWRREELETAALAAERDMQVRVEEPDALLPAVQERLAWQAHEGFFAVIFWYALL